MNTIYLINSFTTNSPQSQPNIKLLEDTLKDYWNKLSQKQRFDLAEIIPRHGQDANGDLVFNGDGLNLRVRTLPSIIFFKNGQVQYTLADTEINYTNIFNALVIVYGKPQESNKDGILWLLLILLGVKAVSSND